MCTCCFANFKRLTRLRFETNGFFRTTLPSSLFLHKRLLTVLTDRSSFKFSAICSLIFGAPTKGFSFAIRVMAASSLGVVFRSRDLRFLLLNEPVSLNKLIALITFLQKQPNLRAILELFNPRSRNACTCSRKTSVPCLPRPIVDR